MPKNPNPGNSGHRGYKMSVVQSIDVLDPERVTVVLACGHTKQWYAFSPKTAEEYKADLLSEPFAFVLGETRIRCNEQH